MTIDQQLGGDATLRAYVPSNDPAQQLGDGRGRPYPGQGLCGAGGARQSQGGDQPASASGGEPFAAVKVLVAGARSRIRRSVPR
ncbi:hypothetical protein [Kitasatospora sp. NPDC088779]|uniref:hypothetical protein n=1 Tax=Kitasatospora sp. NPDC088779 TaxID=3154964 RepID=UPI0034371B47